MAHPLSTALAITALGMTLLFLALVFFYGLVTVMMSILHRHQQAGVAKADPLAGSEDDALVKQVAAIAVALARAEIKQGEAVQFTSTRAATGIPSTPSLWWTLHHQRQVIFLPNVRRTR